jgi:predicted phosphate transport protein (TIGR00153 family)
MALPTLPLFRKTRELEDQIDAFLENISQCSLLFKDAVVFYLREGCSADFSEKQEHVSELEHASDQLRRTIEAKLYTQTLIPESRSDVLELLEKLDSIINHFQGTLWGLAIEKPDVPRQFRADFELLTDKVVAAVENLVLTTRAYFHNIEAVGDHKHKVMFYEKEADKVGTTLKKAIFSSDLPLSGKIHLREFVEHIDNVADRAENVIDRLVIYTIKRTV